MHIKYLEAAISSTIVPTTKSTTTVSSIETEPVIQPVTENPVNQSPVNTTTLLTTQSTTAAISSTIVPTTKSTTTVSSIVTEPVIQPVTENPVNQSPVNTTTLLTTQSTTAAISSTIVPTTKSTSTVSSIVTEPVIQPVTENPVNQSPVNTTTLLTTQSTTDEETIVPVTKIPVEQPNEANATATPFTTTTILVTSTGYNESPPSTTIRPITVTLPVSSFTLNFTLTNLTYTQDLGIENSEKYNSTQRIMADLLDGVMNNTSLASSYPECHISGFTSADSGSSTKVDAICTYTSNLASIPFDEVALYKELKNNTSNVTKLGIYTLDPNSLYVNGYNEKTPTTSAPTTVPATSVTLPFTMNFTITNLQYTSDLGIPNTSKFNSTQTILVNLLDNLINTTSLKSSYSGCQINGFSSADSGSSTKVDAICAYTSNLASIPFDEVALYKELKNNTSNVTKLGIYTLDPNSLYVNGYNEKTPTTSAPTTVPATSVTLPFTMNFTITNLQYTSDLGIPNTSKFNSTQTILVNLLDNLINTTSLKSSYSGCQINGFSSADSGSSTKVDAICAYTSNLASIPFDEVALYKELKNNTSNVTKLGIYTLDPNSLYVNGYNEKTPTTSAPTTVPATSVTLPFTMNFTITNLQYTSDLGIPNTSKFNSTQTILVNLLDNLINTTSLKSSYSGCQINGFSSADSGSSTKVDAICTYTSNLASIPFDEVALYKELKNNTSNVTKLGIYTLDPNSLYVNGYNEKTPTTSAPTTVPATSVTLPFTMNFTITNLQYTSDLGIPNTSKFNSTQTILVNLLDNLINTTSLKSSYSGCQINGFSSADSGSSTKVDAICAYTSNLASIPFDEVALYKELKNNTSNVTKLGIYTLDPNSLYVNGYNEKTPTTSAPTTVPATSVTLPFTMNFTITNLQYTSDLGIPNTSKFNSTQTILVNLLDSLINTTSLKSSYSGCQIKGFSSVESGSSTKVDAICTYTSNLASVPFNAVALYKELKNNTSNVTKLGIYTLDPNSLYVNGYNENTPTTSAPTTVPATSVTLPFTMNFTITNLQYTSDLGIPNTFKFNGTQTIMVKLLDSLINTTSLKSSYSGCQIKGFSSVESGSSTKVDAICTYTSNLASVPFNAVALYKELKNNTSNVTKLGIYTLDPNSLYVNGNANPTTTAPTVEPPVVVVTKPPVEATIPEEITLNFTITNLPYISSLGDPNSAKYNSTANAMRYLLDTTFKNSSLSGKYLNCRIVNFVSVVSGTKVNSLCTITKDTSGSQIDRVAFYNELESMTQGVTKLGSYKLDKDSLYVNGYNKGTVVTTSKPLTTQIQSFGPKQFILNFTITNLNHSSSLNNKTSIQFITNKNNLDQLLNDIFKRSDLKNYFLNCSVTGFRTTPKQPFATAESVCTFSIDLLSRVFSEDDILTAFVNVTNNGTLLGNYTLDQQSIFIADYKSDEPITATASTTTMTTTTTVIKEAIPSATDLGFNINFTIVNKFVPLDTNEKNKLQLEIEKQMNNLYKNSTLEKKFKFCKLMEMRNGSIIASCQCFFEDDPIVTRQTVEKEFFNGTTTGSLLGTDFQLKDVTVTEIPQNKELPFWAIILICLAVLLALILVFFAAFILGFWLKNKKGSYQVQQSVLGTYFPHLDMRKLY
ncbi:mucin-16 [Spea bombifrons]|uniref:mucin-16 n=1 Tax=Spea bombifrons TaxID=233779 RepID=UPI00234BA95D|nr:mucin-16 [Spea bombifrons]